MLADMPTRAEWAQGKQWWWRALVLGWIAYVALGMLRGTLENGSILGALDYHIHEFGHLAFGPFGLFVGVLGGTLTQIFLPAAAGVLLWVTQKDWFALSFCGAWTSIGLTNAAIYCADARALELDLAGLGDSSGDDGPYTGHDWNYMLSTLNILKHDTRIAGIMRFVSGVLLVLSVLHALRLFWLMARAPKAEA